MANIQDEVNQLKTTVEAMQQNRTFIRWAGGVLLAIVVVVVGYNLNRVGVLADRIGDVQVDVAKLNTVAEFVREDVSEIKSDQRALWQDVRAIRFSVDRLSIASGIEPVPDEKVPPLDQELN